MKDILKNSQTPIPKNAKVLGKVDLEILLKFPYDFVAIKSYTLFNYSGGKSKMFTPPFHEESIVEKSISVLSIVCAAGLGVKSVVTSASTKGQGIEEKPFLPTKTHNAFPEANGSFKSEFKVSETFIAPHLSYPANTFVYTVTIENANGVKATKKLEFTITPKPAGSPD